MNKVKLVNYVIGRGMMVAPVSGKSGKLYGQATFDAATGAPVFEMTAREYDDAKTDLIGNSFPGQQWVPVFVLEPMPDNAPPVKQPMPSKFLHLGTHFELTEYGLKIGEARITIEALQAFSREVDPRLWFRLIRRDADGVVTIESKREDDTETPQDPQQPIKRLLAMFTINELRALAKKLEGSTAGTRDDLMVEISEKVSTD